MTSRHGQVVIDIPAIPLVEVLLVAIIILLYRLTTAALEAIALLRSIERKYTASLALKPEPRPAPKPEAPAAKAVAVAGPGPKLPRPLQTSASQFAACLLDETDVNVEKFIDACRAYCPVMQQIGAFTMLSIREVATNMTKIEGSFELAPARYRSMRELLESEVSAGMHAPGGILADPSAAMGLLWARRGLNFWIHIYSKRINLEGPDAEGLALPRSVDSAYKEVLQPFNGWFSQNSISLALRAVPADFPKWNATEDGLREDMSRWVEVVSTLTARMEAMHVELDLEDMRKSI